jgi:F-type H+-transporting ATPase subunit delta
VNLNSSDGSMGILADHVPTMAQLKPGVIDIFGQDDKNTKLFGNSYLLMDSEWWICCHES